MAEYATHDQRHRPRPARADAEAMHVLFYDGSCGLCRRSVMLIRRLAPVEPIRYIDVNDHEAMAQFPQIDRQRALERVILLEPDGAQPDGYDAVTAILRLLPRWRRLHSLARLWPVKTVGHASYHAIGQNRHRISRLFGWE